MPNHFRYLCLNQIHFRFEFNQFVITKTNRLYTWGASPQLIRLLNQSKKRARLAQKFEETKHAITIELEKRSESPCNDRKNENEKESESKDFNKNVEAIPQIKITNDNNQNATIRLGEKDKSKANIEERIKNILKTKTATKSTEDGGSGSTMSSNSGDGTYQDDEYTEHFLPSKVDTDDVAGIIVQVLCI